jgi:hypothetical protein
VVEEDPLTIRVTDAGTAVVQQRRARAGIVSLTLGALGVVFGDIGTSPLTRSRASFSSTGHRAFHGGQRLRATAGDPDSVARDLSLADFAKSLCVTSSECRGLDPGRAPRAGTECRPEWPV